jgi:hypothetical protein
MEPVTLTELGQSVLALLVLSYVVVAAFMVIISPKHGLRRTNRLFRRAISLPFHWLGQLCISLAKIIRG